MIHNMSGGGASLNFKVVGGTTEPANPRENTIWVNTDTEITGWVFSGAEPESPSAGMVWFKTGMSSPAKFDALKKNSILLCLLSTAVYTSGSWLNAEAKIYQGGWVDFNTVVFNIESSQASDVEKFVASGMGISLTADYMQFKQTVNSTNGDACSVYTTEAYDLTNYKTAYFKGQGVAGLGSSTTEIFGIVPASAAPAGDGSWPRWPSFAASAEIGPDLVERTLDISGLSGMHRFAFRTNYYDRTIKLYALELRP